MNHSQLSLQMSSEPVKMSAATRDILRKVKKMVPPMLEKFHKGTPLSSLTQQ